MEARVLHDVAVYDLRHADFAIVGEYVERRRLDVGVRQRPPLQTLFFEFRVRRVCRLPLDGLNGSGAILRLLGASDVGKPIDSIEN